MAGSRLTEEEKETIIRLRLEGKSLSTIAGLTGRSSYSVKKVLRQSWINNGVSSS